MQNKEHSNGSSKKSRLTRYSAYLYLAMALLIVGVATASILMLRKATGDLPEISIPEISMQTPSKTPPHHQEIPVFDNESGIKDASSEAPVINEEPDYILPIENGTVIKAFSADALVFSETMKDYRIHNGIDIEAPIGQAVRCYTDGIVESISQDDFLGITVVVRHEYGLETVYRNLNTMLPGGMSAGSALKAGDLIGYVGATANAEASDPSHLHFEMKVNGSFIDPERELYE